RLEGHVVQTLGLYERAVSHFRGESIVNEEALAYEVAGRFARSMGLETFADQLVGEAALRYARWGAVAKMEQLERLYPRSRERRSKAAPEAPISPESW